MPSAADHVARAIEANGGAIRFDAFMQSALYGPEGFYNVGGRAGRRGDFITSPEVGPLFGAVLARALDAWWVEMGSPDDFRVFEVGAGPGTLARSVLAAGPECLRDDHSNYVCVETSATQRDSHPEGVTSLAVLPAGELRGVVFANELLDNLAFRLEDRVQRGLAFAIVDEVDSILIDEARTPLIISGPAEESTDTYVRINKLVPQLERVAGPPRKDVAEEEGPGDYSVDEKQRQVHLTEAGHERVEALMIQAGMLREGESLYDPANIRLMHHLNAALRAHALYKRDVEYIVRGGEVIIVDEFTGRTMPGRRWSEGLHQAVEAKEGVRVREENQTIASIT
ncbi:MAG: hypothetical protein EBY07_00840, partial [Actinobacteria bacterium]|nr:hypothetical protein [Actinomycetota bacterium]